MQSGVPCDAISFIYYQYSCKAAVEFMDPYYGNEHQIPYIFFYNFIISLASIIDSDELQISSS